jgi:hypothetical protein
MAEIILAETASSSVTTPAGAFVSIYPDTTADPVVRYRDNAGNDRAIAGIRNWSTASQAPAAATLTYITGSDLLMPVNLAQAGSSFRWTFNITKTAAGTALSTYAIVVGTAGTTADTARCSFTKPAGTAAIDEGTVTINAIVRNSGASSIMVGQFTMVHNLAATGHAVIPCVCVNTVSSAFTTVTAALKWGLVVTTGASDAITIQMVQAQAWNV